MAAEMFYEQIYNGLDALFNFSVGHKIAGQRSRSFLVTFGLLTSNLKLFSKSEIAIL
jgi:hypothetical protein